MLAGRLALLNTFVVMATRWLYIEIPVRSRVRFKGQICGTG
jgi:hypothetical protein